MSKRLVMCTSTGCIEYAPDRYLNYGIDIIRVRVNFQGKEYLEGYDLDPVKFYEQLENLKNPKDKLPKTAIPPYDDVYKHFDDAVKNGYDEVIVIALSSYLGGTCNFIRLVGDDFKDKLKITVIDAKITCFGEGLLAIKAAQMVKDGKSTEEIIKEIEWIKKTQELIGVDGQLDYLIYNGRLKGGKAFIGKLINICPVVHFNREGELAPLCSVRTQRKALEKTCSVLLEKIGDRKKEDYLLWHLYTGPSLLVKLKEIEKSFGIECNHEDVIMSPVSGCHNGPWLAGYGLCFIRRPDEPLE